MINKSAVLQSPDSSAGLEWSPLGVIKKALGYSHIGLLIVGSIQNFQQTSLAISYGTQTTPRRFCSTLSFVLHFLTKYLTLYNKSMKLF